MNDPASFFDSATKLLLSLTIFLPTLVGFMAMVSAILPPPDPAWRFYKHLLVCRRVINIMGANVKHAKNKDV